MKYNRLALAFVTVLFALLVSACGANVEESSKSAEEYTANIETAHFENLVANESTRIVYIKSLIYTPELRVFLSQYTPYYSSNGNLCRYENGKLTEITDKEKDNSQNTKSASSFSAEISVKHFNELVANESTGIVYIDEWGEAPYYSSNGSLCSYKEEKLVEIDATNDSKRTQKLKGTANIYTKHFNDLVANESTKIVYIETNGTYTPYYSSNGNLCRYDNGKLAVITDKGKNDSQNAKSSSNFSAEISVKHFDDLVANESTGIVYIETNGTYTPYYSSNGNLCRYDNGKLTEITKEN